MGTIGEIAVNLVARTAGLDSGLKQARRSLDTFAQGSMRAAGTLASLVGIAGGFGGIGFAAKLAADAEQATVAINTMTGSMEVTKRLLADINQFSTVTPFEPTELRQAAQALLAYNFGAGEIMPTLKTLGDISAGTGRRLSEFVNIVGKVRDRGKLTAETLNEFGIRAASIMGPLSKVLGVSRDEIVKLASAGKISFNDLLQALQMMTSEGGLYFDAMAKQSETLAGRWSTLTGNVKLLGENIGAVLLPTLGAMVDIGNKALGFLLTFDQSAVSAGVAITGATVALVAIGRVIPVVVAAYKGWSSVLTALVAKQTFLAALSGPAGWLKIAGAIAATAAVAATLNYTMGGVADETQRVAESMDKANAAAERLSQTGAKIAKLNGGGTMSLDRQIADAERRARAAGFTYFDPIKTPQINARSIGGGGGATTGVIDEVRNSNALLTQIEANTREGADIREADL